MRLLVFLLALLCAVPAQAQTVRVMSKQASRFKQECGYGSATVIGKFKNGKTAVLSCAHVFFDGGQSAVEMSPKQWVPAQIVGLDRDVDLCLLSVEHTGQTSFYGIAQDAPKTGEVLLCRGYPMMKELREQQVHVIGGAERPPLWKTDKPFISGESGGSVVSARPDGGKVVGVIVASDDPAGLSQSNSPLLAPLAPLTPPGMRPIGYIVPWPVVAQFVKKSAPDGIFDDKTLPPAEMGEEKPFVRPPPKEEVEEVQEQLSQEYSKAKIIVIVSRQGIADIGGSVVEKLEGMASSIIGDYFFEKTNGAADVEVVFERLNQERFNKLREESGVLLGDYASVIVLIKKQDAGLLSPMKKIAAGIAQRSIDSKLGQLPVKVIFEREYPERFRGVEDAMLISAKADPVNEKDGGKGEDQNFFVAALAMILRYLREGLPWMRKQS